MHDDHATSPTPVSLNPLALHYFQPGDGTRYQFLIAPIAPTPPDLSPHVPLYAFAFGVSDGMRAGIFPQHVRYLDWSYYCQKLLTAQDRAAELEIDPNTTLVTGWIVLRYLLGYDTNILPIPLLLPRWSRTDWGQQLDPIRDQLAATFQT